MKMLSEVYKIDEASILDLAYKHNITELMNNIIIKRKTYQNIMKLLEDQDDVTKCKTCNKVHIMANMRNKTMCNTCFNEKSLKYYHEKKNNDDDDNDNLHCKVCDKTKPVADFYKSRRYACKECLRKRYRESYRKKKKAKKKDILIETHKPQIDKHIDEIDKKDIVDEEEYIEKLHNDIDIE